MPPTAFEPAFLSSERLQTHALIRAATGITYDVEHPRRTKISFTQPRKSVMCASDKNYTVTSKKGMVLVTFMLRMRSLIKRGDSDVGQQDVTWHAMTGGFPVGRAFSYRVCVNAEVVHRSNNDVILRFSRFWRCYGGYKWACRFARKDEVSKFMTKGEVNLRCVLIKQHRLGRGEGDDLGKLKKRTYQTGSVLTAERSGRPQKYAGITAVCWKSVRDLQ